MNRRRGAVTGGSGDRRWWIEPVEDDRDTSAATSPASGEDAMINLFLAIGYSSSPAHRQRLRMEAPMMAATYQWFRGLCVSV